MLVIEFELGRVFLMRHRLAEHHPIRGERLWAWIPFDIIRHQPAIRGTVAAVVDVIAGATGKNAKKKDQRKDVLHSLILSDPPISHQGTQGRVLRPPTQQATHCVHYATVVVNKRLL